MIHNLVPHRTITGRLVVAGLVSALLAGCSGGDDQGSTGEPDWSAAVNEGLELETEVLVAEYRLQTACMEAKGFDEHMPPDVVAVEQDLSVFLDDPYDLDWHYFSEIFPTVEEAEERGLHQGMIMAADRGEPIDYFEWDSHPPDFDAYRLELYGEEMFSQMKEAEGAKGYEYDRSKLDGCLGEVFETLYDGYHSVEPDPRESEWAGWRPVKPSLLDPFKVYEVYNDVQLQGKRHEWSVCMEERDYPYFELNATHVMSPMSYAAHIYSGSEELDALRSDGQPVPPDAPYDDPEEAYAAEIAFAVDVADCADTSGLREFAHTHWRDTMERLATQEETMVFAWRDQMETALAQAQQALAE